MCSFKNVLSNFSGCSQTSRFHKRKGGKSKSSKKRQKGEHNITASQEQIKKGTFVHLNKCIKGWHIGPIWASTMNLLGSPFRQPSALFGKTYKIQESRTNIGVIGYLVIKIIIIYLMFMTVFSSIFLGKGTFNTYFTFANPMKSISLNGILLNCL